MNQQELDREVCYRALLTRDARFDGQFYTAVLTTGIYCRPICPARPPKIENCVFLPSAAAAEQMGFRPCLRCRPEVSPAKLRFQTPSNLVDHALRQIIEGAFDNDSVENLAERLGISGRHLRRLFARELGTTPIAVAQAQRVLLAKKMIVETTLSMTDVAIAAGFGSVRRFNDAMQRNYGKAPKTMRQTSTSNGNLSAGITLKLPFNPPYDWEAMIDFLAGRAIPGVEAVDAGKYARSFQLDDVHGVVEVQQESETNHLLATIHATEVPPIGIIVARLRRLFDLDANIGIIDTHLSADPRLAARVRERPGLRVPGSWDLFELLVRAVLGQQISVAAATTLSGRLVANLGEPLKGDFAATLEKTGISMIFPLPVAVMTANLTSIGLTRSREKTLQSLATVAHNDRFFFQPQPSLNKTIEKLCELPGIGPWTAHYIAMRGYRDPNAFPHSDLGLLRALETENGRPTPAELLTIAEAWRPWRAYAAMRLWVQPRILTATS